MVSGRIATNSRILTGLWISVGSFRQGRAEKLSFILLNQVDVILTVFAAFLGFHELNPWMRSILGNPVQLFLFKAAIPVLIAWLVPGKLLLPASLLLLFVAAWNIKELVLFMI